MICKISAQYVKACKRKVWKTVYFQYSKFQQGHNSHKNRRKWTTFELDQYYSITKSYAKFQLNISKHVGKKCGKLHICESLKLKRGITPAKIDGNKLMAFELAFTCIKIKWYTKFQLNISKHVGEKCGKLWRTDGRTETRTDGHHHTIIRPVWRRAYKN